MSNSDNKTQSKSESKESGFSSGLKGAAALVMFGPAGLGAYLLSGNKDQKNTSSQSSKPK